MVSGTCGTVTSNAATLTVTTPVTNVSSNTPNGTYGAGTVIDIEVTFGESVTVDTAGGTPYITMATGVVPEQAVYVSGSGTNILTFDYTVVTGDESALLDYTDSAALSLNGGTIEDAAGNPAVLTLPTPGQAGSLEVNNDIVISTCMLRR